MQNKGEMARQLNHIIINGRFSTFKGAAGHPGVTKNKKAPPPSQKPVPKKEMPPPPKRRAPAAKPKPKPKAAKPKASPKAAKIMPVPTAKSPELVTPPMGPQRTSQAPPDFSLGAPVAVLPPQTAPVPVPVHDAPVRQTPRAPPVFLQAPRYPQPQPQPQPQPRPQPQPQLLRGPPAQSDATIPAAQPRGWNDNQELFVPPSVPRFVQLDPCCTNATRADFVQRTAQRRGYLARARRPLARLPDGAARLLRDPPRLPQRQVWRQV